jgi:hypothetical protein
MQQLNEPARQPGTVAIAAPLQAAGERSPARWLKRLGAAGFAFFLLKGLFWLALATLAYLARP